MDRYFSGPFRYNGKLNAPTSKSYFQRAMAIASLAKGDSILTGVSWADDTRAVRHVIDHLGAQVEYTEGSLKISPSKPNNRAEIWNVGESGLALRMFSGIAALFSQTIKLTGHGSLIERPAQPIVETLGAVGIKVNPTNDGLPIEISGPLTSGNYTIDGSFSSQILTGLLIALPLCKGDTELTVTSPSSTPYIDMTLEIIRDFGVKIFHEDYKFYRIPGGQFYHGREYHIEGDWSGAANHLVGAAISGKIELSGLNSNSRQADRKIMDVLKDYGAGISINEDIILIERMNNKPFEVDATHCPDLFPPLCVLAASATGTSKISGAQRLIHKESNRLVALLDVFKKLNVNIKSTKNEIIISGNGQLTAATVDSFNDHRIAMAAAIANLMTHGIIKIERAEAVAKSYPHFFTDLVEVCERVS